MIHKKKLDLVVTELFIRERKLNISPVFIAQSYFKVPKDVRLNTTHFFIAKISNRRELQEIAWNHWSDIKTEDFINIYRKCTVEPCSFLVNDTTLASDNALENYFQNIIKLNDQSRYDKLQYDINREAAKISALSSGKINKYKYLTGEDILPSNQEQIILQARFTYSPLGEAFEKQIKTVEDHEGKQIKAIQDRGQQTKRNI